MLSKVLVLVAFWRCTASYEINDTSDAMAYLGRFGYLGKDKAASMNIVDVGTVLKEFQHMAGINESGVLDEDTVKMMNMPRCGNLDLDHEIIPDEDEEGRSVRWKRYKLSPTRRKWKKRELSYRITKFSEQMSLNPRLVEKEVAHAFKLWSRATNLQFYPSKAKYVDIDIGFASAKHHDKFPFDGPGKTLAHAFPPGPNLGGDVHFDDHERWTVDSPKGTNVLFVAVHEIGHALGLSHSDVKGAIMQAFYGGYRPRLKLHPDDIQGIQRLYGKPEVRGSAATNTLNFTPNLRFKQPLVPTTTQKSVSVVTQSSFSIPKKPKVGFGPDKPFPDPCNKNFKVDAVTAIEDQIYLFAGEFVFRVGEQTRIVAPGWPKQIKNAFKGLEPHIEAAFTRRNGKSYFLKGGKYWRFDGLKLDSGYPKSISKHFPGIPDHVDSAFISNLNGHIYITKGSRYWRFDPKANGRPNVQSIYPLRLMWWGLKIDRLDGALDLPSGKVLLFKGSHFWEWDVGKLMIKHSKPKPIRGAWLTCLDKEELRAPPNYITWWP